MPTLTEGQVQDSQNTALSVKPEYLLRLDDSTLITYAVELAAEEERIKAEQVAPISDARRTVEAELIKRMVRSQATHLPDDNFIVEFKVNTKVEKRINVLRKLETLVPKDEMAKALYLSTPKPEWVADGVKLNALARKYGGDVRRIIEEGMVKVVTGIPKLVITRREQMEHAKTNAALNS